MKRLRGTVKNNVIVLEEGVCLPDGTQVDVRLPARRSKLHRAVERLLANPIKRRIGIEEIIEENKQELDDR